MEPIRSDQTAKVLEGEEISLNTKHRALNHTDLGTYSILEVQAYIVE